MSLGADGLSPRPVAPWQKRQYFWKSGWPAAIDAAFDATGFFSLAATARGVCCGWPAATATDPTSAHAAAGIATHLTNRSIRPTPRD